MIESSKFDAFFRSFRYCKNSSGPSIEPCETLHAIVSSSVRKRKTCAVFYSENCIIIK